MPGAVMGRPKRRPEGKPEGFRTIGVRTCEEWAVWLEGFAKENRTTVAGLIDKALAEFAKAQDYEKPPLRIP